MTSGAPNLARHLIDHYFGQSGADLMIGRVRVCDVAETYDTPAFLYDADTMRASYRSLADTLDGFARLFFSIKANPNPEVARIFVELGAGIEIASLGEFEKACAAGCTPERMLFAGPAKGRRELEQTLSAGLGEIHLETFEEIAHVADIAGRLGRTVPVAIRVNPAAAAQGGAMRMGGKAAAFGFDEEMLDDVIAHVQAHKSLKVSGIHMFAGTQILDASVLLAQWAHGLNVAAYVADLAGHPLQTIDLGGGLGVPYFEGDKTLDLAELKAGLAVLKTQKAAHAAIANAEVLVEPGRFLTASAGIYVMRVRAVKQSRGERFVMCDGGMHHHLAASGNLGQVIKRDFPIVAANRLTDPTIGKATIAGPLCTPLDTLGRKTALPEVEEGDLIAVMQSGAYGLTASPNGFLSHPVANEILVDGSEHRKI